MGLRCILIVVVILAFSGQAVAQQKFKCPAVPKNEDAATNKAGKYFGAGAKFAEKEKYQKALDRYLCSLKMKAHPNTMFNIAQLAKLIEKQGPALQSMKKFRNRNPEHPSVEEINDLIEKMESGELDDEAVEEAPPEEEVLEEPAPDTLLADEEIAGDSASAGLVPEEGDRRLKIAGIVLLASSAATLAMGVGFTAGAAGAKKDAEGATTYSDFQYHENRMGSMGAGAGIGYLLTAGLVTAGIVCLYKYKHPKAKPNVHTDMAIMLLPTLGGAVLSGSF